MRVRDALLILCLSLFTLTSAADDEDDLPQLELLGFLADFSDEEEGWTDPEDVEEIFSLNAEEKNQAAVEPATNELDQAGNAPADRKSTVEQ